MTDLTELRAALADEDTPPDIDVAAVRDGARRVRRRSALAAAATAAAVMAAVAVPVGLLSSRPDTTAVAAQPDVTLRCPATDPATASGGALAPGDRARLVPFAPAQALVCEYEVGTHRMARAALVIDEAVVTGLRSQVRSARGTGACTLALRDGVLIRFAGASGETATVLGHLGGCPGELDPALVQTVWRSAPACPARPPALGRGEPDRMVPTPDRGLLACRYTGGHGDRTPTLVAAAALIGRSAAALAAQADALPSIGSAEPSCPYASEVTQVVLQSVGDGPRTPVIASTSCPVITNGTRRATVNGALATTLAGLTG